MSNVFHRASIKHFQLPQQIAESGMLKELLPGSLRMYILLAYKAQHHTRFEFALKNEDFAHAGLSSPKSIIAAREQPPRPMQRQWRVTRGRPGSC